MDQTDDMFTAGQVVEETCFWTPALIEGIAGCIIHPHENPFHYPCMITLCLDDAVHIEVIGKEETAQDASKLLDKWVPINRCRRDELRRGEPTLGPKLTDLPVYVMRTIYVGVLQEFLAPKMRPRFVMMDAPFDEQEHGVSLGLISH